MREPEPYDATVGPQLGELDSPDVSTALLLIFSKLNEDNGLVTYYGIEAPRNCPMREAFEWGELEWEDYWTHKDVLYEVTMSFNPGPAVGRLITPADLPPNIIRTFRKYGSIFPYELKRRALALSLRIAILQNTNIEEPQQEYNDFMDRFGHRFTNKAA
jgi:hypothetical protein